MKINEVIDYSVSQPSPYKPMDLTRPQDSGNTAIDSIEKLINLLSTDYSEMLKAYRLAGGFLYRGISSHASLIGMSIRKDRLPVELDPELHEKLHVAYTQLGIPATRKNAIFCSAKLSIAKSWGSNPYIVFVKNGWSGSVLNDIIDGYAYDYFEDMVDLSVDELKEKIIELEPVVFSDASSMARVITSGYADVLITGNYYIGLNVNKISSRVIDFIEKG